MRVKVDSKTDSIVLHVVVKMAGRPQPLDRARQWIKQLTSTSEPFVVDARTLSVLNKLCAKIITFSKNPRLNLKNSPPFLQGIMLDLEDLFASVFKKNTIEAMRQNEYGNRTFACFIRHGKRVVRLFKEAGTHMEEEGSKWRRELSKITLVLSHLLAEIRAYFKEGVWCPDFRIAKIEAREFWDRSFSRRFVLLFINIFAHPPAHACDFSTHRALISLNLAAILACYARDGVMQATPNIKNISTNFSLLHALSPGLHLPKLAHKAETTIVFRCRVWGERDHTRVARVTIIFHALPIGMHGPDRTGAQTHTVRQSPSPIF
jgi:hypothetical protein